MPDTLDTLLGALGKLLLLHTVRVGVRIALNFNQLPAAKPLGLIVWLSGRGEVPACLPAWFPFFFGGHANLKSGNLESS